jgi:hypothetical protein
MARLLSYRFTDTVKRVFLKECSINMQKA